VALGKNSSFSRTKQFTASDIATSCDAHFAYLPTTRFPRSFICRGRGYSASVLGSRWALHSVTTVVCYLCLMGKEGKRKRQGRNEERIKRDWEGIFPHACLHMRNGFTAAVRRHVVLAWCHRHPYTHTQGLVWCPPRCSYATPIAFY